ncbi:MAG: hypothetical protein JSV10_05870, partial [Candidatus Zixiibacteriota bacterium]
MRRYLAYLVLFLMLGMSSSFAASLDIPTRGKGISFGNSKRFDGIRLNLVDKDVEKINGVNLTFWIPKKNPDAVMNGLAAGLVGLSAAELNGLSFAGVGSA